MILIIITKSKISRVNFHGLHFHAHLNSLCDNQLNGFGKQLAVLVVTSLLPP